MSGDEVWQLLAEDVVGDPAGVDVVAVANRVDQDNPVAVVGNDVGVSGKRLKHLLMNSIWLIIDPQKKTGVLAINLRGQLFQAFSCFYCKIRVLF